MEWIQLIFDPLDIMQFFYKLTLSEINLKELNWKEDTRATVKSSIKLDARKMRRLLTNTTVAKSFGREASAASVASGQLDQSFAPSSWSQKRKRLLLLLSGH